MSTSLWTGEERELTGWMVFMLLSHSDRKTDLVCSPGSFEDGLLVDLFTYRQELIQWILRNVYGQKLH